MPELVTLDPDHDFKVEVIEKLESLLAAARDGKILSMIYVCEQAGGTVTTGGTRLKDRYQMLGYLAYAMHRASCSLDEDAIPSDLTAEE